MALESASWFSSQLAIILYKDLCQWMMDGSSIRARICLSEIELEPGNRGANDLIQPKSSSYAKYPPTVTQFFHPVMSIAIQYGLSNIWHGIERLFCYSNVWHGMERLFCYRHVWHAIERFFCYRQNDLRWSLSHPLITRCFSHLEHIVRQSFWSADSSDSIGTGTYNQAFSI